MTEHEIIQEAKTTMLRGGGDALRDEAQGLQKQSMLKAGIEKVASAVTSDRDMQREIGHYGSQGLKTAALFFGGRVGMAATVGLYGADEMKPDSGAGLMAVDGAMGAAKGFAMKTLFNKVGDAHWNPATKALSLGIGARVTENVMSRSAYFDGSGNFAPMSGVMNGLSSSFDRRAIGMDLVTFGMSYGMFRGADGLTRGALSNSRVGSTAFMGGSFGLISGTNEELSRQIAGGGEIDFAKIAARGLTSAAVDAVASIPGGIQAARAARTERGAAPDAVPRMQLTQEQLTRVRDVAESHKLWLVQTPKVEFAKDGTPVVMATRGSLTDNSVHVSRLVGDLQHAITFDWNGVRFRVEPTHSPTQVELGYMAAYNSPERLEAVRRAQEARDAEHRRQQQIAERDIDALQSKPAREPEVLMRKLANEANFIGINWDAHAIGALKHPSEINAFARAYVRFDGEVAMNNLRDAGRYAYPGTEKVWKQALDSIVREGPGMPNTGEQRLFADIRESSRVRSLASQHELYLRQTENGLIVMPTASGVTIRTAGEAVGKFAAEMQKPVVLQWNDTMVTVKPNATGTQVEAAWKAAMRKQRK